MVSYKPCPLIPHYTFLVSFVSPLSLFIKGQFKHFSLYSSLEYDPRLYGLYLHDNQQLPSDLSLWDYLDDTVPGYQDSLVLHMIHKPVIVCLENLDDRYIQLYDQCYCFTLRNLTIIECQCNIIYTQ